MAQASSDQPSVVSRDWLRLSALVLRHIFVTFHSLREARGSPVSPPWPLGLCPSPSGLCSQCQAPSCSEPRPVSRGKYTALTSAKIITDLSCYVIPRSPTPVSAQDCNIATDLSSIAEHGFAELRQKTVSIINVVIT